MSKKNNEREKRKKNLLNAIDQPHLLVCTPSWKLKYSKAEGCFSILHQPDKLQFAVANYMDEKDLRELIDFFNEALERQRKIKNGEKAEIIPFNGKPEKGGD